MPRVFPSVLIDTYSHERLIEEAVTSVLQQDFSASDREILVVDDGSTDRTPQILAKLAPQVQILRKSNGVGHNITQGLWMRVNPRTGQNVLRGIGEPAVQQVMEQRLSPGMTFYDLCANIGFFSLLAARLAENLSDNKFAHAVVEEKAVWSKPATVSFARVDSNVSPDRGLGHVSVGELPAASVISVEAISLDQYVLFHPAPDFINCDVEGAEVAVFDGAERLLREKRPVLLVEMHSEENQRALMSKFRQCGYAFSNLDENHVLALPQ